MESRTRLSVPVRYLHVGTSTCTGTYLFTRYLDIQWDSYCFYFSLAISVSVRLAAVAIGCCGGTGTGISAIMIGATYAVLDLVQDSCMLYSTSDTGTGSTIEHIRTLVQYSTAVLYYYRQYRITTFLHRTSTRSSQIQLDLDLASYYQIASTLMQDPIVHTSIRWYRYSYLYNGPYIMI